MTTTLKIYEDQQAVSKYEQAEKTVKPAVIPFVQALNSDTVRQSPDEEIKIALHEGVSIAIFDLGHTKDKQEKEMIVESVLPQVKIELANITLLEIKLFCKLGAQGKYGENMGINVVAVLRWLHAGMQDAARFQAKQAINPPEVLPVALDYSRQDWVDRVCVAFEKYKVCGFYHDFGNPLYNFLENAGLINFTDEHKKQIKVEYIQREHLRLSDKLKITKAVDDIKGLNNQIQNLMSGKEDLRSKLKREALQIYFKDLIETETDLRELLTGK